jgi:hypothetical protein
LEPKILEQQICKNAENFHVFKLTSVNLMSDAMEPISQLAKLRFLSVTFGTEQKRIEEQKLKQLRTTAGGQIS